MIVLQGSVTCALLNGASKTTGSTTYKSKAVEGKMDTKGKLWIEVDLLANHNCHIQISLTWKYLLTS